MSRVVLGPAILIGLAASPDVYADKPPLRLIRDFRPGPPLGVAFRYEGTVLGRPVFSGPAGLIRIDPDVRTVVELDLSGFPEEVKWLEGIEYRLSSLKQVARTDGTSSGSYRLGSLPHLTSTGRRHIEVFAGQVYVLGYSDQLYAFLGHFDKEGTFTIDRRWDHDRFCSVGELTAAGGYLWFSVDSGEGSWLYRMDSGGHARAVENLETESAVEAFGGVYEVEHGVVGVFSDGLYRMEPSGQRGTQLEQVSNRLRLGVLLVPGALWFRGEGRPSYRYVYTDGRPSGTRGFESAFGRSAQMERLNESHLLETSLDKMAIVERSGASRMIRSSGVLGHAVSDGRVYFIEDSAAGQRKVIELDGERERELVVTSTQPQMHLVARPEGGVWLFEQLPHQSLTVRTVQPEGFGAPWTVPRTQLERETQSFAGTLSTGELVLGSSRRWESALWIVDSVTGARRLETRGALLSIDGPRAYFARSDLLYGFQFWSYSVAEGLRLLRAWSSSALQVSVADRRPFMVQERNSSSRLYWVNRAGTVDLIWGRPGDPPRVISRMGSLPGGLWVGMTGEEGPRVRIYTSEGKEMEFEVSADNLVFSGEPATIWYVQRALSGGMRRLELRPIDRALTELPELTVPVGFSSYRFIHSFPYALLATPGQVYQVRRDRVERVPDLLSAREPAGPWFGGSSVRYGAELYRSTEPGPIRVADIFEGPASSQPGGFVPLEDGRLLFHARSPHLGRELWVSDGTEEGTKPLCDLVRGPASSISSASRIGLTSTELVVPLLSEVVGTELIAISQRVLDGEVACPSLEPVVRTSTSSAPKRLPLASGCICADEGHSGGVRYLRLVVLVLFCLVWCRER